MSADDPNRTIAEWLAPLSPEPRNPHSTIKPGSASDSDRFARVVQLIEEGRRDVELGESIGRGGMAEVFLAHQERLGRDVAAKRLRDGSSGGRDELHLIREAWIIGHLEHPNVVPIHDVTVDTEGNITLLLKRIEGEDWSRWLRPEADVQGQFGAADALDWHLGVLISVCHAVDFAHSRGVVHRDLKPENILIGPFGEVVLVDWGIALGLDGTDLAPPTGEATVAGTPVYMSPEMLTEPTRIDARTDVYQLGGLLFHILTGAAPHEGSAIETILPHILSWEPSAPPGVPEELAAIAIRALSRKMEARHPSAGEFRQELQRFLSHRGSVRLTDDADDWGRQALAQTEIDRAEQALDRARFGYVAALAQWPDNLRASRGLGRVLHALVEHRLAADDVRGAERLLADLQDPDLQLVERIARARAEQDRLDRIARRADPTVGARQRWAMATFMGALWILIPVIGHVASRSRQTTTGQLLFWSLVLFAGTSAAGLLFRNALQGSDLNRKVYGWVLLTPGLQAILTLGMDIAGATTAQVQASHFFLWGTMCATATIGVDARLAASAVAYLFGFGLAALFPDARYLVMLLPNTVLALTVAWLFRRSL